MANNSFFCFFNGQMFIKAEQHALNINSLHDLIKLYVCNYFDANKANLLCVCLLVFVCSTT